MSSPIKNIHNTPWRRESAARSRRVKPTPESQAKHKRSLVGSVKALAELLPTPTGTVRVWSLYRKRWRFQEHDDVTIKEARALVGEHVGEYIPTHGAPVLLYTDPAKAAALRATGFLLDERPVAFARTVHTALGMREAARIAT